MIYKLTSFLSKTELSEHGKKFVIVCVYKDGGKIDCSSCEAKDCYQLYKKFCPAFCFKATPHVRWMKLL